MQLLPRVVLGDADLPPYEGLRTWAGGARGAHAVVFDVGDVAWGSARATDHYETVTKTRGQNGKSSINCFIRIVRIHPLHLLACSTWRGDSLGTPPAVHEFIPVHLV